MAIKKSLRAQQKKKREQAIKEVNAVIRNAVKNFDFLSTLLIEGDPEATYHNIMDFRESVEKMVEEINEEMKQHNSK
jgi:methionine synthase II (cobalamin-independent)